MAIGEHPLSDPTQLRLLLQRRVGVLDLCLCIRDALVEVAAARATVAHKLVVELLLFLPLLGHLRLERASAN